MDKYKNILNFYYDYIKLEQIIRKGWIITNVPADRLESVADHTLQLIMLASVITKELNIKIDEHKLTEMLMIHDLGEIIIGDIADTETDKAIKKSKEGEAVKQILSSLNKDNQEYYYSLWLEMENKETQLSKYAFLLDKLDAIIKSGIYKEQYNLPELFKEFYEYTMEKGSFKDSQLEEFLEYLGKIYLDN